LWQVSQPDGLFPQSLVFRQHRGPVCDRIGGGLFYLDEQAIRLSLNDGCNHLHGGFEGFNKKIWQMAGPVHNAQEVGVILEYTSPDGEEGYPGNLHVQVTYTLSIENKLTLSYTAVTDKPTPVNLSNHSYFNLTGFDDPLINGHQLMIHAKSYTENMHRTCLQGISFLWQVPRSICRPLHI